jgi:hypothetical protein
MNNTVQVIWWLVCGMPLSCNTKTSCAHLSLCRCWTFQWRHVSHCAAANSLSTLTYKMLSASWCTLSQKISLLHSSESYQKNSNGALASVGSVCSMLKCDYTAVNISQPVLQVSPNHFWMNLIYTDFKTYLNTWNKANNQCHSETPSNESHLRSSTFTSRDYMSCKSTLS